MDRLSAMTSFVEIAERGSITAAAEALDKSPPALVRSLAALEKHLGTTLLTRTTRSMSLTPEGRDFLARSRRILADVEEAEEAVGPQDGEPSGELRVTAPLQFGSLHVAPLVREFLQRFREIRLDLLLHDRNVDLVEEGIDLGVRIGRLADSSMIGIGVGSMRRVVCASPELLADAGSVDHPCTLSDLPCLRTQTLPRHQGEWLFEENGRPLKITIDGRFGSNQVAAVVAACEDGLGFGRFLYYQVESALAAGRLVTVLDSFEPTPSPVSLVYPGGRLVSARLRALIAALKPGLTRRLAAMRD